MVYVRQAGEKALARSAYRAAAAYFEQTIRAVGHLPEHRDTRAQAIALRLARRSALRPSGDIGRILATRRAAETLAAALDDPRRLGQVSVLLSTHFSTMGAYDQAIATARCALARATAGGEVVLQVLANQRLGQAYQGLGDYRRAIDCFGQTVAALEETRRRARLGFVLRPAVLSPAYLAWCHAELGLFAEGRALGEEGLPRSEAVDHPPHLMAASWGIGRLCLRQGDLDRALPLLARAGGICQDADLPFSFPPMAALLGAAYTLAGRVTEAMPLLPQAMEQARTRGRVDFQTLSRLSLGETQMLASRLEEAQVLADRALAHARAHQERGHQAYALRLLGDIATHHEPPEVEEADTHSREALALANEPGRRPLQAHCHLGLGTLDAKTSWREQARTELSAAITLYRAMNMTFWLSRAEAAVAKVEGR